ncbi:MAG: PSP1 domain-containing protein [Candidatus Muiribacteriota bacterium]
MNNCTDCKREYNENIALKIRNAPEVVVLKNEKKLKPGDRVVAITERGEELATVLHSCKSNPSETGKDSFFQKIKRKAEETDLNNYKENLKKEKKALKIFREKVQKHELPMKIIEVYYMLDNSKIMFYYYAENKVDFRKLVRELAGIYKTRIEMRQVGIRDEAKMRGGLGPCGLITCCHKFLYDFESISMKMAKDQEILLNPSKISGICGRLMCCLKYEQNFYTETKGDIAPVGSIIKIEEKTGKISTINALKNTVYVEFEDEKFQDYPIDVFREKAEVLKISIKDDNKNGK